MAAGLRVIGHRAVQGALALLVLCAPGTAGFAAAPAGENLKLLDFWQIYSDAPNALYKEMVADAVERLDQRAEAVARLRTRADWEEYRRQARARLMEAVGPFPEKTPLNARTLGVLKKDGFRMEKIVYESQPGFYVTAGLFVPEPLAGKAPAILYCSGHTPESFGSAAYQHMIVNLVRRGFIVLAFDPINQGERLQYLNPETGRNEFAAAGLGHSHMGGPRFVLGGSLARLMIWDGIRGIDYLLTRDEVDARRLGITGRSGGGTQSAYIAAFDDRIVAAAPENYITTFKQLLKSRGPQDAEQNFLGGIAHGLDQPDLLIARAPQPALIIATTRDIFSIEGTEAAYRELQRGYAALGHPEAIAMTVDDADHTSTRKNREATYAFFQRHLNLPGDATDLDVGRLTREELRITETGQVATSLRGETVPSMNRRDAARAGAELDRRRQDPGRHLPQVKTAAARLAGYERPARTGPEPVLSGRYQRDGYAVEKYLLPVDDRYAIPVLAMVPAAGRPAGAILYLHPEGKAAAAKPGGEMEWLVQQGHAVIAPDVIGAGEVGTGYLESREQGHGAFRTWFGYVLVGRSIVGRQVQDVMRTLQFIEQRFGIAPRDVAAVARGASAPLLLHATAVEDVCAKVALIEPLLSYESLVSTPKYPLPYLQASVPAALTAYDLPDLAACLAPRKLLLAAPRAGSGSPAATAEIDRGTAVIRRAYAGHRGGFVLVPTGDASALQPALAGWLE